MRQPGKPTRTLPSELIIMNTHSPPNIIWHFAPKIWTITPLKMEKTWELCWKTSDCWHTNWTEL